MNAARGFTLLELLIGMTLLGFILALLFGGFRLAANSWDAVETRVERTNDQQLARALVRRLLAQMQPLRLKKVVNQRYPIAFVGEREVLRAVAPLTGQAGAGGLRFIELSREGGELTQTGKTGSGPLRLVLRHAPLRYDAEDFAAGLGEAKSNLVLDGLDSVEFSYFGPEKIGEPPRWQDTWTNPEQLPQLVRLRLGSRDTGWAELVVAPVASAAGCLWDNFYKRCT
jgi:general secretion pathway protein J